jgi:TetR/AcrR family transcriptional regulator, regulator of cefoperazone and chloramphenicol sensitivity
LCNNQHVRAAPEDLTTSARILGAAMRLFAERGFDATSIRDVAAEAGVSSSLVVHHFKTKAQLKAATDARLIATLTGMLAEMSPEDVDLSDASVLMAQALREEPELFGYLRRMLVDGGEAATGLFLALVEATATELAAQEAAGVVLPSADPHTRATFLIVNDLGAIILGDLIEQAIGIDPFTPAGMEKWGAVAMDVYARGVYAHAPDQPDANRPDANGEER